MPRTFLIVIDGLGIGAQEDAAGYGDSEADTLGNVSRITQVHLPNFEKLGLGNIRPLHSIRQTDNPVASYGKMREVSAGKDSTTGHWELAGIHLEKPFPTYPAGFPDEIIERFCQGLQIKGVLCNLPYSGTKVIEDYGHEHIRTGMPIVYTSADSVFQLACHTGIIPLKTLYQWCEFAREHVMEGEHAVGRVIARPFTGASGSFMRISEMRHDYSLSPPVPNLMSYLQDQGIQTCSIGKIKDLFGGKGFTISHNTNGNADGISRLLSLMSANVNDSFTFVNLIDTDQIYGHRQDPAGFALCLQEIDRSIPSIYEKLGEDDILIFTADHGNDPADNSTDHTREFVPVLVIRKSTKPGKYIGTRSTFSDAAKSVLEAHGIYNDLPGASFYGEVTG
jgi:phosphopentomutase